MAQVFFALSLYVLIGISGGSVALAHSSLLQATPADGAILSQAPHTVRLIFNEPVAPEVLTLITPDGQHNTLAHVQTIDNGLAVALPALTRAGTYAFSWRIISADGHPVGGTLFFSIGSASPHAAVGEPVARALPQAIWTDRVLLYAGLLFGVGSVLFGALVAPLGAGTRRFAIGALLLALLSMPVALALQGMDALGARWSALTGAPVWRAAMNTSYGISVLLMLAAVLAAMLALAFGRRARVIAGVTAVGALLLASAFATTGHASTAAPFWLARPAVFLHILSVLGWVGSLAPLIGLLREPAGQSSIGLARFSRAIPFALFALVASGVTLILLQIDRPAALWQTDYGRVLCAKLCLLLMLLAVAAFNRYRLTGNAMQGEPVARRRLITAIRIEIGLVLLVLAVVSLWRFTPPPRALDAKLGTHLPNTSLAVHLYDKRIKAQLNLNLDSEGHGQATIAVENADGTPLHPQALTLQLGNAADAVEAFSRVAVPDATGRWKVDSLTIPIAGNWEVGVDVLISDFDQVHLLEHVRIPYPAH